MEQVLFQVREVVVALNKEVNEKMAERVLKPNSPRWLDCDLNCTACEYASDCIFKLRHDEAEKKVWLKTKRKKKQKRIKRKPTTAAVNTREGKWREGSGERAGG